MKCFAHPSDDAVGMCSQCGKAGCTTCLRNAGGALWCRVCLFRAEERKQDEGGRTPTRASSRQPEEMRAVITDVRMPFFSMVFMVKWAFAAIPALIIIYVIIMIIMALGFGLLAGK